MLRARRVDGLYRAGSGTESFGRQSSRVDDAAAVPWSVFMSNIRPWWVYSSLLALASLVPACASEESSEDAETGVEGSGDSSGGESDGGTDAGGGEDDCGSEADCSTAGGGGEDGGGEDAASETDGAACEEDADCAANESCTAGACIPIPDGGACGEDADCSNGEVCEANECVSDPATEPCESNADCNSGEVCDAFGVCVPDEEPVPCTDSIDCGDEASCQDGVCVTRASVFERVIREGLDQIKAACEAACSIKWDDCNIGSESAMMDCLAACGTRNTRLEAALTLDDTGFDCVNAIYEYSLCRKLLTCEQLASEAAGTVADSCAPGGAFQNEACTSLGL